MNTDTGQIHLLTEAELASRQAAGERLVPIDPADMTPLQYKNLHVSPHDTRSTLGRRLRAERSKYTPHTGAKQNCKAEYRHDLAMLRDHRKQ